MHDAAHDVVVAQGQQVSALSCARVPAAQADGPLVWQQHVVLCMVEDSLCPVHLPPAQASTCVQTERVRARVALQVHTLDPYSACSTLAINPIDIKRAF